MTIDMAQGYRDAVASVTLAAHDQTDQQLEFARARLAEAPEQYAAGLTILAHRVLLVLAKYDLVSELPDDDVTVELVETLTDEVMAAKVCEILQSMSSKMEVELQRRSEGG